jgi:predicted alternative tryptophan synthase beta-subunit
LTWSGGFAEAEGRCPVPEPAVEIVAKDGISIQLRVSVKREFVILERCGHDVYIPADAVESVAKAMLAMVGKDDAAK